MENHLNVLLTQTRNRKPLAQVCNLPGDDADLTPQQLRTLAAALYSIADECEAQPMTAKHFSKHKRQYMLAA